MTRFTIPTLETERLILRAPQESDFAWDQEFYRSEAARFVGGPKEPHQAWRNLAMLAGHWVLRGFGIWGLEDKASGTYQGRVGLWYPHGWYGREIGWTLMPHAWGHGYATEAALAARAHAYDVLGWDGAISQIYPRNAASKAVAERLGARLETVREDPEHGPIEVWRHLAPDEIENGGMEAYA